MAIQFLRVSSCSVVLDESPSAVAGALARLSQLDVTLVGISEFPVGRGKVQLDLITSDSRSFARAAAELGCNASRGDAGFLVRGDGALGKAMSDILQRLAGVNVPVLSLQAMPADGGGFCALLRVNAGDVERADNAFDAIPPGNDLVDETSLESFPASDPPSWAMTHRR